MENHKEALASLQRIQDALKSQQEILKKVEIENEQKLADNPQLFDEEAIINMFSEELVKDQFIDALTEQVVHCVDLDSAELCLNGNEIGVDSIDSDTGAVKLAASDLLDAMSEAFLQCIEDITHARKHAASFKETKYKVEFNTAPNAYIWSEENLYDLLEGRYQECHSLLHQDDLKFVSPGVKKLIDEEFYNVGEKELINADFKVYEKQIDKLGRMTWKRIFYRKQDAAMSGLTYDLQDYCNLLETQYEELLKPNK